MKNLTRIDYDTIYKCKASNTNLILPTERRIQLKLTRKCFRVRTDATFRYLYNSTLFSFTVKPLYAKILKKYREMLADQAYQLTCESSGSRPPAIITWWSGDTLLNYTKVSLPEYLRNIVFCSDEKNALVQLLSSC